MFDDINVENSIEIWDTQRKQKITSLRDPLRSGDPRPWGDSTPNWFSLSPDGRLVAMIFGEPGGMSFSDCGKIGCHGAYLDVWNVSNKSLVLRERTLKGFSIEAFRFLPDGQNLVWGGGYFDGPRKGKGEIKIRHIESGKERTR